MRDDSNVLGTWIARLIAQHANGGISDADAARGAATSLAGVSEELSRWMGPDGCNALLTRALSFAREHHSALADVRVESHSTPVLVGVEQSIRQNDPREVADGLVTTMVQLFELVRRLIGDELTLRIAEKITTTDSSAEIRDQNHGPADA